MPRYTIGLDYGTGSVRAVLVSTDGEELAAHVFDYPHGVAGVVISERDPNLARQHPRDYEAGAEAAVKGVLQAGREKNGVRAEEIIGIGIDTTGSTPLPVDAAGMPLAYDKRFENNVNRWLGSGKITLRTPKPRKSPQPAPNCDRNIWPRSAIDIRPSGFGQRFCTVPALHRMFLTRRLVGSKSPIGFLPCSVARTEPWTRFDRGVCAAGHKAFFNANWGGYPDAEFLKALDPRLERVRKSLPEKVYTVADAAGSLSAAWAERLGLKAGIPVAVGAFDVHLGAVGSGIAPGTLVKIMGTSTCDLAISPVSKSIADVPGICGIVPGSVMPGFYGMEAGQSAVGDIFNWFVNVMAPAARPRRIMKSCRKKPQLKPGESGLLVLDWHNGNRTILVDQRLTGMILGLTLHSSRRNLSRADRSHRLWRPRHHGTLRRIGCPAQADRQRRRHRGEEPDRDADLCGHHGPPAGHHPQPADLCPGRAIAGAVVAGKEGRRIRKLRRRHRKNGQPCRSYFHAQPSRALPTTNSTNSTAACTTPSA